MMAELAQRYRIETPKDHRDTSQQFNRTLQKVHEDVQKIFNLLGNLKVNIVTAADGSITANVATTPITSASGNFVPTKPTGGAFTPPPTFAPTGASYVTLGLDATLTAERVLTAGYAIQLTDTGANGTITAALTLPTVQITTNGTLIASGTAQAQPAATISGVLTTSVAMWSLPNSPVATWQTGIVMMLVCSSNTVTPWLVNPTTAGITPAAQVVNIKAVI